MSSTNSNRCGTCAAIKSVSPELASATVSFPATNLVTRTLCVCSDAHMHRSTRRQSVGPQIPVSCFSKRYCDNMVLHWANQRQNTFVGEDTTPAPDDVIDLLTRMQVAAAQAAGVRVHNVHPRGVVAVGACCKG